jgi:hypothetical protein
MGRFVRLDENNIVIQGVVVADEVAVDESSGISYLRTIYDSNFTWRQTYKDKTRKNYAGIGYKYDSTRDAFIPPQPFTSWTLNDATCRWEPPTVHPDDGKMYNWDEDNTEWKEKE